MSSLRLQSHQNVNSPLEWSVLIFAEYLQSQLEAGSDCQFIMKRKPGNVNGTIIKTLLNKAIRGKMLWRSVLPDITPFVNWDEYIVVKLKIHQNPRYRKWSGASFVINGSEINVNRPTIAAGLHNQYIMALLLKFPSISDQADNYYHYELSNRRQMSHRTRQTPDHQAILRRNLSRIPYPISPSTRPSTMPQLVRTYHNPSFSFGLQPLHPQRVSTRRQTPQITPFPRQSVRQKSKSRSRSKSSRDSNCLKTICNVCFEYKPEDMVAFNCGHTICLGCRNKLIKNTCPTCRKPIKSELKIFLTQSNVM